MKRLADIFREGFPQTTGFFKITHDNGKVEYCALGYLVDTWEKETGKKFPYKPIYYPNEKVTSCYVNSSDNECFLNEVLPHFGLDRRTSLTILVMNDAGRTPQEIAEYLETLY